MSEAAQNVDEFVRKVRTVRDQLTQLKNMKRVEFAALVHQALRRRDQSDLFEEKQESDA